MFLFFLFWAVGMFLLYWYLRNVGKVTSFKDVIVTTILGAGVGLVFSYAASKANLNQWALRVAFLCLGAFISYKFFEKKNIGSSLKAIMLLLGSGSAFFAHAQGSEHHMFDGSVWVLPLMTIIGAIVFGRNALKAKERGDKGGEVGYEVFTVICILATIGILVWLWLDK